ncbi:hypothetical protein [Niabella ginsengisoli]|uniref:DUF4595 domain-containing protein n=1 Tax=Niabella ginsengisoli TaxID=522298 RepID=A0ABS9SNZ3_9BACT|nr:hypothetical protein [Niabella ginsengisoli]MCH5600104.1 hypothetical protein [Niabella ginsengisoli]
MKQLILLLLAGWISSCNNEYITQTETRSVDNNGKISRLSITRKLRMQDKLPVSVLTESTTQQTSSKSLDSIYYNANGKAMLVKSYKYKDGAWELIKSYRPL